MKPILDDERQEGTETWRIVSDSTLQHQSRLTIEDRHNTNLNDSMQPALDIFRSLLDILRRAL